MLAVVDRAFLISIPALLVSVLIGVPTLVSLWVGVAAAGLTIVAAAALVGQRRGLAKWRGTAYAFICLATGCGALWKMGPITGVGAMFGVGVLFAGTFMSPRGLAAATFVSLGAIALRVAYGNAESAHVDVGLRLWIGTALACGVLLWLAVGAVKALVASLERSYQSVADAYAAETTARTELERSRAQLDELAQVEMVGRLAGGVAHDVNNALAAILAATDVLASEVSTPEHRRHLAELEAASYHAADLVRDLLWTGRRFPASTTATSELVEVTRGCLERVKRVARRIAVDVQLQRIQLAVSAEHLEQILFSLIVGADRTGVARLALAMQHDGSFVELSLVGVLLADKPAMREMQVQLGASAARELVGQYRGTLETRELAGELVIKLRLPVAARAGDSTVSTPAPMRTALVVEDEPMVLRRLCQLVARRGYEVSAASTVAEGMRLLARRADLLVTDMQLPDGSGEQIAIASFEQNPSARMIVCSGFTADDIMRGRLRDAPLTFLPKPFSAADFDAALAALVQPSTEKVA